MKQMVMSPAHSGWSDFLARLESSDACDFHEGDDGNLAWRCGGGTDKSFAETILAKMGFDEVSRLASFELFEEYGGYCDGEIIFNVEETWNWSKGGG